MSRERLVVVGNGMAATRLVEGLVGGGYAGHVTVLGDEPAPAYNRILLSAVLEGTHDASALTLRSPAWFEEHGIDLRRGSRVLTVDREHSDVMLVDGTLVPWDRLVLATGSIPSLPPIRGLVRLDGHEILVTRPSTTCQADLWLSRHDAVVWSDRNGRRWAVVRFRALCHAARTSA